MLRRKLGLKMGDLKELRVKLVSTWCTSCNHMLRAKESRTKIITNQSKVLPSRRRRRRRRIASCAVPLIIGQRSAQTVKKEENLYTNTMD
jgi:hypothetical protein